MVGSRRVLVTGGTGRIGRYLVRDLAPDYRLAVLARDPDRGRAACLADHGTVDFFEGDLLDPVSLDRAMQDVAAVVHIAGLDFDTVAEPRSFIQVNAVGTWNVLEAARHAGVAKVVIDGSVRALGLSELRNNFPPRYLPIDDDHPRLPTAPYAVSKLAQEEIGRAFADAGDMTVICLRLAKVMFPDKMEDAARQAADPAGHGLFSYITPEDVVVAHRAALEAETTGYQVMIISAADSFREEPILDTARRVFGHLPEVRDRGVYEADPHASLLDWRWAYHAIGFQPSSSWSALRDAHRRGRLQRP